MARHPRVVIDACALYPNLLRDALLSMADAELFEFIWSEQILEEVRRNLVMNAAASAEKAERTIRLIAAAFREGGITGYERHLESARNHPKDRHVVAAALESGATIIVTSNLRDFASELLPEELTALSPDDFLLELLEASPSSVEEALREQSRRLKNPPIEPDELVRALGGVVPRFAAAVLPFVQRTQGEKP